jgi:hypothetical protein
MVLVQTLYYNEKFGYINGIETINSKNNLPTLIEPVITFDKDVSSIKLATIILEGFEKAKATPVIVRNEPYKFWEVAGVKSFKTFSKRFTCIDLEERNGICIVKRLQAVSGTGGYVLDKEFYFEFDLNDLLQNIYKIKEILTGTVSELNAEQSFKTLEGNLVSYQELPDSYEDLGDGHTDAYQMYADSENSKNLLAFMIDNGYDSFESKDIESKFIQFWGPLEAYEYTFLDDEQLYARVYALSTQYEIYSYIFKDGDSYLEIQYQLDRIHTSTEQRKKIQADFEELIQSVKIEKA